MKVTKSPIKVRYAETDQMGIVHHSNYPIWLEVGRTDFIKELGMAYSEIEKAGVMIPMIRLDIRYVGSAKYEDELMVITSIKELGNTRIIFNYEIQQNKTMEIITHGFSEHVFTSSILKPVNLKKYSPNVFSLLEKGM